MKHKLYYKIFILVTLFVVAVLLANLIKGNSVVQDITERFGYMGVFILGFVSGFNVWVPVPAMSFLSIFTEAGLNVVVVVAVVSFGMTCGDTVGYLVGKLGRKAAGDLPIPSWIRRIEEIVNHYKYGLPTFLFLYAGFVPLPNELIVVPAAATGREWYVILVPLFLGNVVFNTLIFMGITSMF
ncbi:MAG: hypothetical protein WCV79_01705 [Candidatus Paceibacterota bacterium]